MGNTFKQLVGTRGEDEACNFLKNLGFAIVERNFWRKWGEIDVIARKGDDLRFVEVKAVTRNSLAITPSNPPYLKGEGNARNNDDDDDDDDYEPEDNIHPWKRKRLRRVIETYLVKNDWCEDVDWQIDIIAVYLNREGKLLKVEHLEDVAI